MKKTLLFLALLFTGSVISAFGQATGSWYTPVDYQALTGTIGTDYGTTATTVAISTAASRTGSTSILNTTTSTSKYWWNVNLGIVPGGSTGYVHLIFWAKSVSSSSAVAYAYFGDCVTTTSAKNGPLGSPTSTSLNTSTWTRVTGYVQASLGNTYTYYAYPRQSYACYFDDFVMYYDNSTTTDVTEPEVAPSAVTGTTASLSWTNGSDAGTGVQGTLILGTNAASPTAIVNGTNLLDQGYYPEGATVATDWTVLTNISGTSTTTYDPTTTYTTYAIINYDMSYNFSAATTYTPSATGVNLTKTIAKVYTSNKSIVLEGNAGANVSVISLDGIILYSGTTASTKETLPVSLQTGVYAVIVNGVATKVIVK